ncbi:16S rRNA (guanine(966)-N(2))-methyltransferase RsmD [Allomuricauda sp. d1]|uniref:16S rRNA (guanine(966)-N(2))-methyltransferase RsmD n=1 Tax=Allomuricauda sp. d1 TaxID=3136725 RepID=UPI0031E28BBD
MRIISGKYKGKRLNAPKNLPVRPTTDMAKEALFNILANRFFFEDVAVFDLFSGTGNISFEFASRGAQHITAVDVNSKCAQFISKTATALDFEISVIKSDVFKFLERTKNKADIIFADPPYAMETPLLRKIPEQVFQNDMLKEGGLMVIEHGLQINLSDQEYFSESRKYGSSVFSFFEKLA